MLFNCVYCTAHTNLDEFVLLSEHWLVQLILSNMKLLGLLLSLRPKLVHCSCKQPNWERTSCHNARRKNHWLALGLSEHVFSVHGKTII